MRNGRGQIATRWIIGLTLAAAVAVGAAVLLLRYLRPQVDVAAVGEGPVVQAFYATGTLVPEREFPINANVEGIIERLNVDKGQRVRKDEEVAFIRVPDYEYRYEQAVAELKLKQSLANEESSPQLRAFDLQLERLAEQLKTAEREVKRLEGMMEKGTATSVDRDRAADRVQEVLGLMDSLRGQRQTRKLELLKDVDFAEAAVKSAKWFKDQQSVRSPIDGVVLDWAIPRGTRVRINDRLMNVADVRPASLVMRSQVDEEDRNKLVDPATRPSSDTSTSATQPDAAPSAQLVRLTLYAFPGRTFIGRLKTIYPMADSKLRTFEVDVQITPPDDQFAAGMTGELAFVTAEKPKALLVPSQAVTDKSVWVVRDGVVRRVEVHIGLSGVEATEITGGLSLGDSVVVSPANSLRDGQAVRFRQIDFKAAADRNKRPEDKPTKGFN